MVSLTSITTMEILFGGHEINGAHPLIRKPAMSLWRRCDPKGTARRPLIVFLTACLLILLGVGFLVKMAQRDAKGLGGSKSIQPPTPINAGPNVKYVGDAACAGCHLEIAKTYHQHPMARSFGPVAQASEPLTRANSFLAAG